MKLLNNNIKNSYDINDINKSVEEIQNILTEYNLKKITINKSLEQLYEEKGFIYSQISDNTVLPENISDADIIKYEEIYNNIIIKYNEHLCNKPTISYNELILSKDIFNKIINEHGSLDNFKKYIKDNYITIPKISLENINDKLKKYDWIDKNEYQYVKENYFENKIIDIKKNISDFKKTIDIHNKLNSEYLNLLENNIKKPDISLDEIKKFITSYSKYHKNKETLTTKIESYNKQVSIKNSIDSFNDIIQKYKTHHYNDNCWACKKQLWKIELDEIKIKKENLVKEYSNIIKITEKQNINNTDKLKYIIDNEYKYNEYIKTKYIWKDYNVW